MRLWKKIAANPLYKLIKYYCIQFYKKQEDDHMWVLASAIAFNLLICVIPFVLILLTILGIYLESSDTLARLSTYLENVFPLPPEYKEKFISSFFERAYELTSNTFLTGALGLAGLIWTMSGLISTMRDVMNRIFRIEETMNFFLAKLKDIGLVLAVVVLFLLTMAVTSLIQFLQQFSEGVLSQFVDVSVFSNIVPFAITFVISFALFYLLYTFIPHLKFPRRAVLLSTVIASVLFEVVKYFFTFYLLKLSNFGKIYGAYAAFAISLIWIYYVSVIFVAGVEFMSIFMQKNNLHVRLPGQFKKTDGTKKII